MEGAILQAAKEHSGRIKERLAPLIVAVREIQRIAGKARSTKGTKTYRHDLKAASRNALELQEAASVFKVATSENQVVLQSVAETAEICALWMKTLEDRLENRGPSVKQRHEMWKAFLRRAASVDDGDLSGSKPSHLSAQSPRHARSRSNRFSIDSPRNDVDRKMLKDVVAINADIHSRKSIGGFLPNRGTFKPRVSLVQASDPLKPWIYQVKMESNLATFSNITFELDISSDSIVSVAEEFAEEYAEQIEFDSVEDLSICLQSCLREALKQRPESLSLLSDRGKQIIKSKVRLLTHLLHLAIHEVHMASLIEVDSLVHDRKVRRSPLMDTAKIFPTMKKLPEPKIVADEDEKSEEGALPLRRLEARTAFRFGEIEPSQTYLAEARQSDWETLQRQWWTTKSEVEPHVLIVTGPGGVGKSDYAKFVCGTLTHLIPRFAPGYHVQHTFSPAVAALPGYLEALLNANPVDWRREVVKKIRDSEAPSFLAKHNLSAHQAFQKTKAQLFETFRRVYHRRRGVILLDNVPPSRLEELLTSPLASLAMGGGSTPSKKPKRKPKKGKGKDDKREVGTKEEEEEEKNKEGSDQPPSRSVLVITIRNIPKGLELPKNVVVQKLAPFSKEIGKSVMIASACPESEPAPEEEEEEQLAKAFGHLVPFTGGYGLGLRVLSGFAIWGSQLRKKNNKSSDAVTHIYGLAKSLHRSDMQTDEEKVLRTLNLDSDRLPKATRAKRGFSAALDDIDQDPEDEGPSPLAATLAFVFARLPRIARAVFRGLFVFGGPFTAEMVGEALQTKETKAVEQGLEVLLKVGFLTEAPEVHVPHSVSQYQPGQGTFVNEGGTLTIMGEDTYRGGTTFTGLGPVAARAAVKRSLENRRYVLGASAWRFCYLLNRLRKMPEHGRSGGQDAALRQRQWLGTLSKNFVRLSARLWRNLRISFEGSHVKSHIGHLGVLPPLRHRGEGLGTGQRCALDLARVHSANLLCAGVMALCSIHEGVDALVGEGVSLLGLITLQEEVEREIVDEYSSSGGGRNPREDAKSKWGDKKLGDPRLLLLNPHTLHHLIFPSRALRTLFSSYVRLNTPPGGADASRMLRARTASNATKDLYWTRLPATHRGAAMLAARRAWGWLNIAMAYEENLQAAEGFDSFSAAFQQLRLLSAISFPDPSKATQKYASAHLRCITGLCRMAEKAKGIHLAIKYLQMAVQLIEPMAEKKPLSHLKMKKNFRVEEAEGKGKTNGNAGQEFRERRERRHRQSKALWTALARLRGMGIRLYTKMGAFQNAVDDRAMVEKICKALGKTSTVVILTEADLAVGDTYLRLGMWEQSVEAFSAAYTMSIRHHSMPGAQCWRALALSGRADASMKSGSFYECSQDREELRSLVEDSDEPLIVDSDAKMF